MVATTDSEELVCLFYPKYQLYCSPHWKRNQIIILNLQKLNTNARSLHEVRRLGLQEIMCDHAQVRALIGGILTPLFLGRFQYADFRPHTAAVGNYRASNTADIKQAWYEPTQWSEAVVSSSSCQ